MNAPTPGGYTPDTGATFSENEFQGQNTSPELREILEEMFNRQRNMEAELQSLRAIRDRAEAERQRTAPAPVPSEVPLDSLMRTLLETLTATSLANSAREPSGPREWKPPIWDGRADTFRDYLLRIRSSYRVRSAIKPTLPKEYY